MFILKNNFLAGPHFICSIIKIFIRRKWWILGLMFWIFFHKKDPCILYHVGMMGCDSYLFISTWGSNPALRHREWTRSGCLVLSSAISGTPWTCWPPPPPSSTCVSSPWTGTGPSPTPSTTPSRWVTSGRPPSSWSSGSAPAPSPSLPSPGGDWRLTVVKLIQRSKKYLKIFS